ncbi:MAG: hypothetical protein UV78_C0057G0003 [Parcubacteria group bacterium GW2011_GWA2_43_17]|nr:MAG: hypothetical protein UV78_C0057G0003 [Parcubacteria group bacterium GW2011_GWA2_43_17]OHB45082.1 MAG: hypothetical protein A2Y13_04525 [Planctomycetes bacterium GWC2_45_44]
MKRLFLISIVLSFYSVCLSQTVEIPVSNYSFEVPRFAESGLTDNSWWQYGPTVAFEPDGSFMSSNYPGQSLPDGLTIVQMGRYQLGGFIGQPLPVTLQPNTIYTFTVYVGTRVTEPFDPDPVWGNFFGMRLKINDGSTKWGGATIKKVWTGHCYPEGDYYDVPPVTGQFVPMTLTLDSSTITDPNLFGKSLLLSLEAGEVVIDFDKITATMSNASLTGVPVTINATPAGINTVNILGTHTYAVGTSLFLRADWLIDCPEVYKFDHWAVNDVFFSNQQEIVIDIDAAKTITAVYVPGTDCATMSYEIPIVNGDFEAPAMTLVGDVTYGYIATGWTASPTNMWGGDTYPDRSRILRTNDAGWDWNFFGDNTTPWYAPGGMEVPRTPYGEQVESSFIGSGWSQTLLATLAANTTYTLQYDVGFGKDYGTTGGAYRVQLFAGDIMVMELGDGPWGAGGIVGAEYGQVATPHNNWVHQTVSLITGPSPAGLGGNLIIKIWNDGARTDNYELAASVTTAPVILTMLTSSNGTVNPTTVVPTVGQHTYPYGIKVNVAASRYAVCPDVDEFANWIGDVNDTTASTTFVRMEGDRTVTGVFENASTCGDECHPINRFDSDGDCDVDFKDFAGFAETWYESYGTPVTIVNGNFEAPAMTLVGDVTYGNVATGWTASGTDMWGNPGSPDRSRILRTNDAGWDWNFFGDNTTGWNTPGGMEVPRTPYGQQVESSFLANGWMQTLSTVLAANTSYVLDYDAGFGKDCGAGGAYRVQLFAGDIMVMEIGEGWGLGGVVGAEYGQVVTARNNWTHQKVSFTTGATPAGLGGNLKIKIWSDGGRTDNYVLNVCSGNTQFDSNGDCRVDLIDLAAFVGVWLECTNPACD